MRAVTGMAIVLMLGSVMVSFAAPSLVEQVADGVYVVRDDTGLAWGGWSMGVAHMNKPGVPGEEDPGPQPRDGGAVGAGARGATVGLPDGARLLRARKDPIVNGLTRPSRSW